LERRPRNGKAAAETTSRRQAAPGVDAACTSAPYPTVWLVLFLLHPLKRAGDGADKGAIKMAFGVPGQEGRDIVIFEGARGVSKPARAPAKDAGEAPAKLVCRGIITANRARRIRKVELLPGGLEEEHVGVLHQVELQRAGRTGRVGHHLGAEFGLPGE